MMAENIHKVKKVPRSAVKKAYWYKMFFRQGGGYTYSMGTQACALMGFIITALYKDKSKIGEELSKYCRYYDTNIPFDGLVTGVLINLEEQRAANPELVPPETIQAMQTSLMGPVGNIGDVIQQAIIAPLALSIGIALAGDPLNPSVLGPIFSIIMTGTATIVISYWIWMKTYDLGSGIIGDMVAGGLSDKLLKAATILGCTIMGAMIPKYVSLTTSIAWINENTSFILQTDVFDRLMPSILSLGLTLIFLNIFKKGAKPAIVIWITMAAAILLSVLGIIGPVPTV